LSFSPAYVISKVIEIKLQNATFKSVKVLCELLEGLSLSLQYAAIKPQKSTH